ncbi:similar to beta-1,4-endoglucanase [Rhizoctonia solani AG-1 IB]|uniref:cellulase n=1 Tax=Thanatephorus cucumeris (strain AG1-IB / isolate 7/3/14) TaxID=1108050 RepID=M5BIT6_THACB|nr:similar to beta-1,4-endoglucanase [Rhizoctonia solani AG-1 IB]
MTRLLPILALQALAALPRLALAAEQDPPNHANSTVPYTTPSTPKYNYAEVIHKSLLFYHSQRSGALGPNRRLAWRGDSCLNCIGTYGEDLTGGYYEAANTMLAWNVYAFPDGFKAVNELDEALEGVKWGTDYLVNCIANKDQFVGQLGVSAVGKTDVDFGYFGPPEEYDMWVPLGLKHSDGIAYINSSNPSSEILGEAAASMAATSLIFAEKNKTYSDNLLQHSIDLYTRATTYQGSYMKSTHPNLQTAKEWYPSSIYTDELAWAAAWLYAATKDEKYRTAADGFIAKSADHNNEYSWDEKLPGVYTLLFTLTKNDTYKAGAEAFFKDYWPGGNIKQTAKGLAFLGSWGSLGYASATGFLMMNYAKTVGYHEAAANHSVSFSAQQLNYILGDCGRSWVVGFGESSPVRPYHKSSYNSFIDYPMRGKDNGAQGEDFLNSKTVTQDYNAAFTGLNAAMIEYYGGSNFKAFSDCGLDLGWSHPNATNPPKWPEGDCYHTCATTCNTAVSGGGSNPSSSNSNNTNGSTGGNQSGNGAVVNNGAISFTFGAIVSGVLASLLL